MKGNIFFLFNLIYYFPKRVQQICILFVTDVLENHSIINPRLTFLHDKVHSQYRCLDLLSI